MTKIAAFSMLALCFAFILVTIDGEPNGNFNNRGGSSSSSVHRESSFQSSSSQKSGSNHGSPSHYSHDRHQRSANRNSTAESHPHKHVKPVRNDTTNARPVSSNSTTASHPKRKKPTKTSTVLPAKTTVLPVKTTILPRVSTTLKPTASAATVGSPRTFLKLRRPKTTTLAPSKALNQTVTVKA